MKKSVLFILVSAILCAGVFAKPKVEQPEAAPEFTVAANATIINAYEVKGKFKDNIRLINDSSVKSFSADVYFFDTAKNEWVKYGSASLVDYKDTSFVSSKMAKKVKDVKFFAVVPQGDAASLKIDAAKEHNDLYFYFR